jgi:hypothetical protein
VKRTGISSSVQEFSKYLDRSSGISIGGFKNSVFTDSDGATVGDTQVITTFQECFYLTP